MQTVGKHQGREFNVDFPPMLGGLNVTVPPSSIDLSQISDGWNVWVTPSGDFSSRPGILKVNTTAFPDAIANGFYSGTLDKTLVATYGRELYVLNESTGDKAKIGNLNGTAVPDFADFMGKCFIASGGILQVYDGTTLSNVVSTTSNSAPAHAIFLESFENRLWAAETGSKLNFCGTRDYVDWGGAVENSGGFIYIEDGDGAEISGLGLLEGNPIVFKGGLIHGPYSISRVTGTNVEDYSAKLMTRGLSCLRGHTVQNYLTDLLFIGKEGLFSHQQVKDFDNPRSIPMSLRVSTLFKSYPSYNAVYDPVTGYYFVVTSLPVLCWHANTQSWYQWTFSGMTPRCVFLGKFDDVLFGSNEGDVHRCRNTAGAYKDNGIAFQSSFTTGILNGGSPATEKLWKWLVLAMKPLSEGAFALEWRKDFSTKHVGSQGEPVSSDIFTDWDGAFRWDEAAIGWDQDSYVVRRRRLSCRGRDLQLRMTSSGGFRLLAISVNGALLRRTGDSWR